MTVYDFTSSTLLSERIRLVDYFSEKVVAKSSKSVEKYLKCKVYSWHTEIELLGNIHKDMAHSVMVLHVDGDEVRRIKMETDKK